jgi:hypothetical protein
VAAGYTSFEAFWIGGASASSVAAPGQTIYRFPEPPKKDRKKRDKLKRIREDDDEIIQILMMIYNVKQ